MVFEKSILISNDIWEKVKSNNNNFSSIKKKKKKSSAPPIKKPKLQEEQKQKLPTIPNHSIRYELNERAKERRKKSNIMKNAKILAKGIRADEEILKFFRPNASINFVCVTSRLIDVVSVFQIKLSKENFMCVSSFFHSEKCYRKRSMSPITFS